MSVNLLIPSRATWSRTGTRHSRYPMSLVGKTSLLTQAACRPASAAAARGAVVNPRNSFVHPIATDCALRVVWTRRRGATRPNASIRPVRTERGRIAHEGKNPHRSPTDPVVSRRHAEDEIEPQ